jgi:hypothetical protein
MENHIDYSIFKKTFKILTKCDINYRHNFIQNMNGGTLPKFNNNSALTSDEHDLMNNLILYNNTTETRKFVNNVNTYINNGGGLAEAIKKKAIKSKAALKEKAKKKTKELKDQAEKKKQEVIIQAKKKKEELIAKAEKKKEELIIKAEKKKEELITKAEQKKEELIIKAEKKKEKVIAKIEDDIQQGIDTTIAKSTKSLLSSSESDSESLLSSSESKSDSESESELESNKLNPTDINKLVEIMKGLQHDINIIKTGITKLNENMD